MNIDAFKAVAIASTFVVALLGGLLPPCIASFANPNAGTNGAGGAERILGILNAASAGVFLSAGLLHLLADSISNESLSDSSEKFWGDEGRANTAISVCLAGFLFLLSVEQFTYQCSKGGEANESLIDSGEKRALRAGAGAEDEETEQGAISQTQDLATMPVAVTVMIGLCIHSVMEGLALGAQEEVEQGVSIFLAIMMHKGLAAFALGNEVLSALRSQHYNREKLLFGLTIALFSLATPAGIALGWTVAAFVDAEDSAISAVLSAAGAGTFLFVATIEMIPQELGHNCRDRLPKMIAVVVGSAAMGILAKWA